MFAEQASSSGVLGGGGGGGGATGLLNEGGGEQQASCLVAKQAVEFLQVYTSSNNYIDHAHNILIQSFLWLSARRSVLEHFMCYLRWQLHSR